MNDRPLAAELLAAARQFLESELIPGLSDARIKFQTLVTANVLAIVERELSHEQEHLQSEWSWLAESLGLDSSPQPDLASLRQTVRDGNQQLCKLIRGGAFDAREEFALLAKQLREVVERKLQVANPRYLASFTSRPR